MKIRRRLAALLAASIVTTAPVITMGATKNSLTRTVVAAEEDSTLGVSETEITTPTGLTVKFEEAEAGDQEVFYLELTNAQWDKTVAGKDIETLIREYARVNGKIADASLSVKRMSKTVVKVTYTVGKTDDKLFIPLFATLTGGEATVAITTNGSNSSVSEQEFVFAKTAENKLSCTVGEPEYLYLEGILGDIEFSEAYQGSMKNEGASVILQVENKDYEFSINLLKKFSSKSLYSVNNGVYTFVLNPMFVEYLGGFGDHNFITKPIYMTIDSKDASYATVKFPAMSSDSIGKIKLQNLPVEATSKSPEVGQLLVSVLDAKGEETLTSEVNKAVLGTIAPYTTYMFVNEGETLVAGKASEVVFRIGEMIEDSMIGDREVEIYLDGDAYFPCDEEGMPLLMKIDDQSVSDFNGVSTLREEGVEGFTYEYVDEDCKEKGISKIIVTLNSDLGSNMAGDYFDLKTTVMVPVSSKDVQAVYLRADGRGLNNPVAYPLQVKSSFNIEVEPMHVRAGLKDQTGGKITLTETEAGLLEQGEIVFEVVNGEDKVIKGVTFHVDAVDAYKVEANTKTSIEEDLTTEDGKITLKHRSSSKNEPAVITLSNLKVTLDGTVPDGTYSLKVSGNAIDEYTGSKNENHYILVEDFMVVGEGKQVTTSSALNVTSTFTIGETTFTVNGETRQMDAAAYVQAPGYTMVPVRYVAEAFGVSEKDILFSNGTVTMFIGNRTISLTNNSETAVVNGAKIAMQTKVVIKDGRLYAPIGEIASLMGLSKTWDGATKTATFTNN